MISLSSRSITCLPGKPQKLCAHRAENSQNFWVGWMPPGYSRGSWCDLRVLVKLMFGHVIFADFESFPSHLGFVRPGRVAAGPWPPATARPRHGHSSGWLRLATAGCGQPGRAVAGQGGLQPAAAGCSLRCWVRMRLRLAMAGRWKPAALQMDSRTVGIMFCGIVIVVMTEIIHSRTLWSFGYHPHM